MTGASVLCWSLVGLPLGGLLGAGAVLGALVVGLYFLRARRRRVVVPFIAVWEALGGTSQRTALLSRATRLLSLLLQLVLLFLLLLALADPRETVDVGAGRSLVLLIDVSASMATPRDVPATGSRLVGARDRASQLIAGLGPSDQMLLVELGARPRPVSGWSHDRGVLEQGLAQLEVLDTSADLAAGLRLGRDALADQPGGEIVVLSDGALDLAQAESVRLDEVKLSFEAAITSPRESEKLLDNIALTSFAARRYPRAAGGFEVLFAILNASERDVEVELVISAAGAEGRREAVLELSRLPVPRGQTVQRSLADLSGADGRLVAEVRRLDGRGDAIVRDNVAYAVLPPERKARVLVVGEPNTFVDAALLLDSGLSVQRVTAAAYPPPGSFDVTLFDGAFPPRAPVTGAALYWGVPSNEEQRANYPVGVGKELSSFGFDHWEKGDPVFRFLDPYDIQVLTGRALEPGPGDRVLGRSDGGVLLVSGERPEGRFLALGFAPAQSDMVLRAAFPVFLFNAIDALVPERASLSAAFATGELVRFAVPGVERGRAVVRGPRGRDERDLSVPIDATQGAFFAERAGFYEVAGGDRPITFSASLLDPRESALVPRSRLKLGERSLAPVQGLMPRAAREPWAWIVSTVLAISFLEWLSFHRRWTV